MRVRVNVQTVLEKLKKTLAEGVEAREANATELKALDDWKNSGAAAKFAAKNGIPVDADLRGYCYKVEKEHEDDQYVVVTYRIPAEKVRNLPSVKTTTYLPLSEEKEIRETIKLLEYCTEETISLTGLKNIAKYL